MKIWNTLTGLAGGVIGGVLVGGLVFAAGWDGSGNVTLTHDWTDDRDAGIPITASRMDQQDEDLRGAIENAIAKDGQNAATADLPMGTNKHINVGNATARTHYGVVGQIQDNSYLYAAAAGTVDALTASLTPAVTLIPDGMRLIIRASGKNTSHTPTLNLNGIGGVIITRENGRKLCPGDIAGSDHNLLMVYNSSDDRFELLNPATPADEVGTMKPYASNTQPDGCWLFAYGQTLDAVTNTYYLDLYNKITTLYGAGTSSAFVLPDLRGRVIAGQDDMGGTSANRLTAPATANSINGDTMGAAGGHETHTLLEAELAEHAHAQERRFYDQSASFDAGGSNARTTENIDNPDTANAGSNTPHNNVQPTIVMNWLIRY